MIAKDVLYDLYVTKRMSSRAIAKKYGMKHDRTVRKLLERFDIPRRTISESITKYPKVSFSEDLRLKSYLLGLRAGDFHVKRIHKVVRAQTTTTHPAQIEMMKSVFGSFSHVGVHTFLNRAFGIKQWFIYCDLNESFSFLLEKPKEIPDWIMREDELFYRFLAAYADCEGSWKILRSHKDAIRFVFQLGSQDREILYQITKKLSRLGFAPNLYLDAKAGMTQQGKKLNLDMYRIMLYRTEDVLRLITVLLPLSCHQEKRDKMALIRKSEGKQWKHVEQSVVQLRNRIKQSRIQSR